MAVDQQQLGYGICISEFRDRDCRNIVLSWVCTARFFFFYSNGDNNTWVVLFQMRVHVKVLYVDTDSPLCSRRPSYVRNQYF